MRNLGTIESIPIEQLREDIMDRLTNHYSRENLSMDEFELRAEKATKANTHMALLVLVSDLPALPETGSKPSTRESGNRQGNAVQINYDEVRSEDNMVAIFSGSQRKGVFKVAKRINSVAMFGGNDIDLRKAIFPPEGVKITVFAVFGGVDIILPTGVRIDVKGIGIMGGFDHRTNDLAPADAPLVTVEGLAIFGGASVRCKD